MNIMAITAHAYSRGDILDIDLILSISSRQQRLKGGQDGVKHVSLISSELPTLHIILQSKCDLNVHVK